MRLSWVLILPVSCSGITCGWIPRATSPDSAPSPKAVEVAPAPHAAETLGDLVRTINDDPDILHTDYSPSVHKLIKMGDAAILRMLDLMLSDDEDTRLRAQRVLEGIMLEQHGFGQGWRDPEGEERFRAFWNSLGGLNWKAPREDRENAVKLWQKWFASRKG